jgi:hypothetical protein
MDARLISEHPFYRLSICSVTARVTRNYALTSTQEPQVMPSIRSSHFPNGKAGGFLVNEFSADMGNSTLPNDHGIERTSESRNKLRIVIVNEGLILPVRRYT